MVNNGTLSELTTLTFPCNDLSLYLTFRTLFRSSEAIWEEPPEERGRMGYPLKAGHYVPQGFQAPEAAASSDGHSGRF